MMVADLPLFAATRAADPETIRDAARRVSRRLGDLHRAVVSAVAGAGRTGLTDRELERLPQFAGLAPSTARKRRSEAFQAGLLVDAGRRDGLTVWMAREGAC